MSHIFVNFGSRYFLCTGNGALQQEETPKDEVDIVPHYRTWPNFNSA